MNKRRNLANDAREIELYKGKLFLLDQRPQPLDDLARSAVVMNYIFENFSHFLHIRRMGGEETLRRLGVAEDRRKRLVQLVGERRRKFAHGGHPRHMGEVLPLSPKCSFGSPAFGDVNRSPDIPEKRAVGFKAGYTVIQDPTIFTVKPPQAVFRGKIFSRVERVHISFNGLIKVVGMDALRPTVAELLLHGSSGTVEPDCEKKRHSVSWPDIQRITRAVSAPVRNRTSLSRNASSARLRSPISIDTPR